MKKTLVTFSVASMLLGSLAACGVDQPRVQNVGDEPRTFQMNQPSRGPFDLAGNRDRVNTFDARDRGNFATFDNNDANPTQLDGSRTYQGTFDDVPEDFWSNVSGALVIEWAEDVGLFEGVEEGKFAPNKALTRAEAAMLLSRLHKMGAIDIKDENEDTEKDQDGKNNDGTEDPTGTDGDGAGTEDPIGTNGDDEGISQTLNTRGTAGLGTIILK